VCHPL
jgi:hypothetical protein